MKLSLFLLASIVHASEPQLPKAAQSNFGTFWNFATNSAEPVETFQQTHKDRFGQYINSTLPEFQQTEYALLFGQIKYHFDNELEFDKCHHNTVYYLQGKLSQATAELTDAIKNDFHFRVARNNNINLFNARMLSLARWYAFKYHTDLSEEQKAIAKAKPYGRNGVYYSHPGARVFEDINQVARTLHNADVPTTKEEVMADAVSMVKTFRDAECVEYDKIDPTMRAAFAPHTEHKTLYAETMFEYIKAAQEFQG